MKKILKKAQKTEEGLAAKYEEMETVYWDRPKKWRESDRGQAYEDRMLKLDMLWEQASELVVGMQEWLGG